MRTNQLPPIDEIILTLKAVVSVDPTFLVKHWYRIALHEIKHRGTKEACAYLKMLYTQAIQIACGKQPSPIPWRVSTKNGMSKDLRPYYPFLKSDNPEKIRIALTVLKFASFLKSPPSVDLKSITDPPSSEWTSDQYKKFERFLRESRSRSKKDVSKSQFPRYQDLKTLLRPIKIRGKIQIKPRAVAGPNGRSALFSAHRDYTALLRYPKLVDNLKKLSAKIDPIGSLAFWTDFDLLNKFSESTGLINTDKHTGRLSLLQEGGCKTRVIAIGDFASQTILQPIHDLLMARLGEIRQDGTWRQDHIRRQVKSWTEEGLPLSSLDLTSATDRFPLKLQEITMSVLFQRGFGRMWGDIISRNRDFSLRRNQTTPPVKYGAGQAMGLYTSWSAFALTHHCLVQYCAHLERKYTFDKYAIIGDDVVIGNHKVARRYQSIMKQLGVSISLSKSLLDAHDPSAAEITKSILIKGHDVTPIPPGLLSKIRKNVYLLPALISWLRDHWNFTIVPTPCMMHPLTYLYSRKAKQEIANILIMDPVPQLAPKYKTKEVNWTPALNAGIELEERQTYEPLGPWENLTIDEISSTKNYLRKVIILSQYADIGKGWYSKQSLDYLKSYEGERIHGYADKLPFSYHPVHQAKLYVVKTLGHSIIKVIKESNDTLLALTLDEMKVESIKDPTMRSYLNLHDKELILTSRVTLETLQVLRGKKDLPKLPTFKSKKKFDMLMQHLNAVKTIPNTSPSPSEQELTFKENSSILRKATGSSSNEELSSKLLDMMKNPQSLFNRMRDVKKIPPEELLSKGENL